MDSHHPPAPFSRPEGERAVKAPSSLEEGVGGGGVSAEILHQRARTMRNNPTEPEKRLWIALRSRRFEGTKFRRQDVIGQRIVDFFCPAKGLVIEIDGDTHDAARDAIRDARMLSEFGFGTVRFTNAEVMGNLEGCLTRLQAVLQETPERWNGSPSRASRHHPPAPSSKEEGAEVKRGAKSPLLFRGGGWGWWSPILLLAACAPVTPAPDPAPPPVQPNNATYGTDANLPASAPRTILRYAEHPRGFAELRLPDGEGPFPLAVIYHGGCWKTGIASQAYMAPLATRWQSLGIATLNVDYREIGDGGGWPGSFKDWAASAKLIDEVAARYPIDRERVTLVGHSAGGLPAHWLARAEGPDGPLGKRAAVKARAAIVLDGPGDVGAEQGAFDALCQFAAVAPFMGAAPDAAPARYAAIAPATGAPQLAELLFVQARLPAPAEATVRALAASGARVTVRENAGASHFAIITPGNPAYVSNEPAMLAVLKGAP